MRAVQQVGRWRLIPGGILHHQSEEDKCYQCDQVRTWQDLPGTVVFVGCDCPDESGHLRPLRAAMQTKGCGAPVFCKHHHIRLLLAGHTIGIPAPGYIEEGDMNTGAWLRVRAREAAK